jgi:hypothetical protein
MTVRIGCHQHHVINVVDVLGNFFTAVLRNHHLILISKEISRSTLVRGAKYIHSYGSGRGTGQSNTDGTGASACGRAALNFARIVFSTEEGGLKNAAFIQAVLARECAEVRQISSIPLSELILISEATGLATFI